MPDEQTPKPIRKPYTGPTFKDEIKPPPSPRVPVKVVYIPTTQGRRIPS